MDEQLRLKVPTIMESLNTIMTQVMARNDTKVTDDLICEKYFVGKSVPDMPLSQYLSRCKKYFRCCPACMIVAAIYIDRITSNDAKLLLHSLNVHRLFATALVLACKFLEDQVFSNKFYAQVAGVSLQELNRLELQFVTALSFDFSVTPEKFNEYSQQLAFEPEPEPEPVAELPPATKMLGDLGDRTKMRRSFSYSGVASMDTLPDFEGPLIEDEQQNAWDMIGFDQGNQFQSLALHCSRSA